MLSFEYRSVANDRYSLWKLGITHVLNAAHGRMYCQGSHDFYGSSVDYYGVPADDSPSFDLSRYFFPSAEYIQSALDTAGGKYPSCCFNVNHFISECAGHSSYSEQNHSITLCRRLIVIFIFLASSGFCPLCSWSEQVCLPCPGLSNDPPTLHSTRGHQ